jgi:hypothetical protein
LINFEYHANRNIAELEKKKEIIFRKQHLHYNAMQEDMTLDLFAYSQNSSASSNEIIAFKNTFKISNNLTENVVVQKNIWNKIISNKTEVFLHVLLIKQNFQNNLKKDTQLHQNMIITTKMLSSGNVLHGSVRLIKHDKIPKYFKQRYLLSDFNLVNISTVEGYNFFFELSVLLNY